MSRKFDFNLITFSRDQITEMNWDDLQKELSRVKRVIKEATLQGRDTTKYEIEYCYLDHERQLRHRFEHRPRKKSGGGYY